MVIYVSNLSYSVTALGLKSKFSEYGYVSEVRLLVDNFCRHYTGYGLIDMPNRKEAQATMKALNDSSLNGRIIKLSRT